jgi:hypothetical protein
MASMCVSAQEISGVHAEQSGRKILISYDLESDIPCEISLLLSLNQGNTWSSPLQKCTGSIGQNISSGNHVIAWDVLADRKELWGDDIRFRVTAKIPQPKSIGSSSQQYTRTITSQSSKKLNGREIAWGISSLVGFIWLLTHQDWW